MKIEFTKAQMRRWKRKGEISTSEQLKLTFVFSQVLEAMSLDLAIAAVDKRLKQLEEAQK